MSGSFYTRRTEDTSIYQWFYFIPWFFIVRVYWSRTIVWHPLHHPHRLFFFLSCLCQHHTCHLSQNLISSYLSSLSITLNDYVSFDDWVFSHSWTRLWYFFYCFIFLIAILPCNRYNLLFILKKSLNWI